MTQNVLLRKKCLRISVIEATNVDKWIRKYAEKVKLYKLLDSEWEMGREKIFMVVTTLDKAGVGKRFLESGCELTWKNIKNT